MLAYTKDWHINLEESNIMEVMDCDNATFTINV